jgi:hypothetical protein
VQYELEGSVRTAVDRVRITCRLVDTSNGMHVWAERFDCAFGDIFDVQDWIMAHVVSVIGRRLQCAVVARARRNPTESLSPSDYFLRGTMFVRLEVWQESSLSHASRHSAVRGLIRGPLPPLLLPPNRPAPQPETLE